MPVVNPPKIASAELLAVQKVCELSDPYCRNKNTDALFVMAMKENLNWHKTRNPFYARLLKSNDFDIECLVEPADCAKIPMIPATFFKLHETVSVNKTDIILNLTSSGTSGQKSQMFFDDWSIHAPQRMIEFIFDHYGWNTPQQKTNYILYSYEVEAKSKLGTAYTDHFLCGFAPINEVFTSLRSTGTGKHEFDVFGTIEKLMEFERQGLPVRIFGFPSFLHATLQRMKDLGLPPLKLSKESLIFLGGGWKGAQAQAISSDELYRSASNQLGIPFERIRDGYGSVEHCIPYVECKNHHFHVPVWSQVYIRDLKSLSPLPLGQEGFLQFVSPYITSVPAQSVLMDDLATMHSHTECGCGIETPFFKILGRASKAKNKSCAIAAAELLRGANV